MDDEYEMGEIGEVVEALVIQGSVTQGKVFFLLFFCLLVFILY